MTRITSKVHLIYHLLSTSRFRVPWHQRDYDWRSREVNDFLHDLRQAHNADKACYFLGSIMLLDMPEGTQLRINDGQQRLITFSLLMAALSRQFAEDAPGSARETMALRTLFDRPANETSELAAARDYTPRIVPPRNDRLRYHQLICGHDIGTNGLLTAAWNTTKRFVDAMDKPTREAFSDFLMKRVEVSVLTVPTDVDANLVFETLNARGRSLDDVDLIRNLLYSRFSATTDAGRLDMVHANLQRPGVILPNKAKTSDYFRCYLRCCYGFLRKESFHRDFRAELESATGKPSDHAFDLVTGLGDRASIELFRAIFSAQPSETIIQRLPKAKAKRNLIVLLDELKGYRVSHPLSFALLHRFLTEADDRRKRAVGKVVARSMKNLASFIMRGVFVTSSFRPSRIEESLANCAQVVFKGTDLASLDIMACLDRNDAFGVIDDDSFVRQMTDMEFHGKLTSSNSKALRYLFGINAQQQVGSDVLRLDKCSVEHVLPQSDKHWQGWPAFSSPIEWVYRAGNLVVVSQRENRGDFQFNADFEAKKAALAGSSVLMARTLADDHDDWTPDVIQKRSKQLAEAAARIWTFRRGK